MRHLTRSSAERSYSPRRGTERLGGAYMPFFTAQRLSLRQVADVRAFLAVSKGRD